METNTGEENRYCV